MPIEKSFHYSIPASLLHAAQAGVRVEVPFGPKRMIGYLMKLVDEAETGSTKDIIAVIDAVPVVSEELLRLARWMSTTYLCSLGEALATVIPATLRPPKRSAQVSEKSASYVAAGKGPALTEPQKKVLTPIVDAVSSKRFNVFLLHGVTGSGKTEVYLTAIGEALKQGRSAVFLLPEISLTPQFVSIVMKRFPGMVGLWHSRLSPGERYRTWEAARAGRVRIMLGARSAAFAPLRDIGLIVVDEEHEPSYKQEQKPSYLTRDVTIERARINEATVIFGSATPSLEMYHAAKRGYVKLLELKERVVDRPLPTIRIVDPQKLYKNSKILSEPLMAALTKVLARREQAILFLNRRGFAPGVICQECGTVWQCPQCSVSLVYHKDPPSLHCHYCDYQQPWSTEFCPTCKTGRLVIFGVGTQRVEEELKKLFPQGRIFRLDRDTAAKKGVYEMVYDDFKKENYDILLGTQMVAKGFDFPRVTLVGVIDADTALYLPDFRAAERTFQLITQVAGRAGRSNLSGEVVVQSKHPEHYALAAAQKHDFVTFYQQELEFRRQMKYPPFCRLLNLLVRGKKEEKACEAAEKLGDELFAIKDREKLSFDVLGPSQAARYKLYNQFRWQILLKADMQTLLKVAALVRQFSLPSGVLLSIDIDPQDTL